MVGISFRASSLAAATTTCTCSTVHQHFVHLLLPVHSPPTLTPVEVAHRPAVSEGSVKSTPPVLCGALIPWLRRGSSRGATPKAAISRTRDVGAPPPLAHTPHLPCCLTIHDPPASCCGYLRALVLPPLLLVPCAANCDGDLQGEYTWRDGRVWSGEWREGNPVKVRMSMPTRSSLRPCFLLFAFYLVLYVVCVHVCVCTT